MLIFKRYQLILINIFCCIDLERIDIEKMKNLKKMGYTQSQAAKVLIKTDNDFDLSLAILNSNSDFEKDDNLEKVFNFL